MSIYEEVINRVLKQVKVNREIWNSSTEAYLPDGEQTIIHSLLFSFSSPFTFQGLHCPEELIRIFKEATNFAVNVIVRGERDSTTEVLKKSDFRRVAKELMGSWDIQDYLILQDILVVDFILHFHGLNSGEFKSGISVYDLANGEEMR
jgi:hypothetical protein